MAHYGDSFNFQSNFGFVQIVNPSAIQNKGLRFLNLENIRSASSFFHPLNIWYFTFILVDAVCWKLKKCLFWASYRVFISQFVCVEVLFVNFFPFGTPQYYANELRINDNFPQCNLLPCQKANGGDAVRGTSVVLVGLLLKTRLCRRWKHMWDVLRICLITEILEIGAISRELF